MLLSTLKHNEHNRVPQKRKLRAENRDPLIQKMCKLIIYRIDFCSITTGYAWASTTGKDESMGHRSCLYQKKNDCHCVKQHKSQTNGSSQHNRRPKVPPPVKCINMLMILGCLNLATLETYGDNIASDCKVVHNIAKKKGRVTNMTMHNR